MFEYPLPVPRGAEYELLGVGPESTAEEVGEAKQRKIREFTTRKNVALRKLKAVYERVDGLQEAQRLVEKLRDEETSLKALQKARSELAKRLRKAQEVEPEFDRLRKEADDLEARIVEVSSLRLQSTEDRQAYHERHPPQALLQLADCTQDGFATESRVALFLLRRELAEFLAAEGDEVFHASDLTRTDFSGDFTPSPLLDGEREER